LWNDIKNESVLAKLVRDTVKNVIAFGFNPAKTFIFSSFNYMGQTPEYYRNIIRVRRSVTYGQIKNTFGFTDSDPIGKIVFPSVQLVPALSTTFPEIFGGEKLQPLIVAGLDQEPYFRLMHDIALKLEHPTPILLHSVFFPALHGARTKMSTSDANSAIFLSDTAKQIKTKINKHAFSGGRVTLEEHREFGGNTNIDVSYHLLRFFQQNDQELEKIRASYSSGELLSGEIKKHAIDCIQEIVTAHQERKNAVSEETVDQFMKPRKMN
jgi:tryptophanyl-tRNA synthetase